MTRDVVPVALAVLRRDVRRMAKSPALFVPALVFPLFFLISFAGGLSSLGDVPGFDFRPGYTGFQYVFVLLQSAAFGGVFTGFGIAADFERGFARRLLLAAPHRRGLLAGYVLSALARFAVTSTVLTVAALAGGMEVLGTGVDLFGLLGLAVLVSIAATLWAAGVAMRFQSVQAGPLMQIPVFVTLFLAPVYVPLGLLSGWIHAIAQVNPATFLLEAGRGFLAGEPVDVGAALACAAGLVAVMLAWSLTGLRRAERTP